MVVDLLEYLAETGIVGFRNGVLGGKPQVLLSVDSKLKAAVGKGANRLVGVMHALDNARCVEVMDHHFLVLAALAVEDELGHTGLIGPQFHTLVHIAVSMARNGYRFFPVFHHRVDGRNGYRSPENGAVHNAADGTVRTLPHLMELILGHALRIGGDSGTFHGHTILAGGTGRVDSDLIAGLVAVRKTKVVVFCLQVNKRKDKLVLDHLPQYAGHLVAIHLHERGRHLNLFHKRVISNIKLS